MNYLAHLYLSFGNEEVLAGNFMADRVKGRQVLDYPQGIQTGIRLHRLIDSFTDQHPVVEISKSRIRERYRKFAGIVIDMYYDHYLAVNWRNYSDEPLLQFTRNSYKTLFRYYFVIPPRLRRILPWMAAGNWLVSYSEVDNIGLALKGLTTRIKVDSGIENGATELRLYYDDFRKDFEAFFPELVEYAKEALKKLQEEEAGQ
jgi:acyl carrier protein phosphodiesterase